MGILEKNTNQFYSLNTELLAQANLETFEFFIDLLKKDKLNREFFNINFILELAKDLIETSKVYKNDSEKNDSLKLISLMNEEQLLNFTLILFKSKEKLDNLEYDYEWRKILIKKKHLNKWKNKTNANNV